MSNKPYWIVTALFGLFFLASGFGTITQQAPIMENFTRIGLPAYMSTILGFSKIFGSLSILIPQVPRRIKVLSYDGFLILVLGGIGCHMLAGDPIGQSVPLMVAGLLGIGSYLLWTRKAA